MALNAALLGDTRPLAEDPIKKLFYRFAIPSALGMLVNSLYIVADGVFIARGLGNDAIAAVNIGYPIINLTAALSLMFGAGGATLISLHADNQLFKNRCFTYTILLNLAFYLLIAGIVFAFPNQVMEAFGATPKLLPMVKGYLYPCLLASFFLMLSLSLNAIVRNDNAPRKAMNSLFIGAITNIVLDYVFIFPMNLGIQGGAYATALGQIFSALYLCSHFPNSSFKLEWNFKHIDWSIMRRICTLGFSSFILEFAVMVITVLLNIALIRTEGELGVAAYGIIAYTFVIPRMFFTGLAQGIQPVVSFNYGQANYQRVIDIYRLGQKVALGLTLVTLTLAYLFSESIVRIYSADESMIPYTANGLFLYTSAIVFVGANFMNISYLQAMDRARIANSLSICRGLLFMILGLSTLPRVMGVNGIWLTLPFADVMTFATTFLIFKYFKINDTLEQLPLA